MSTTRPKTKVVIRNLPPGMTEDTFKTVLESLAGGRYTWLSYFPGKVSLKRVVFSRAYVNFLTAEDVYDFKQCFDGHVFIGQKGHQYKCSVEYAPLQKVPSQEEKPHPLDGTIEKDTDYLAFLEVYESGQNPPSTAVPGATAVASDVAAASGGAEDGEGKVVMSRLMEYLVQKYAEGGNRLGGMRAVTKAKQSKQDLIQQVQVSAQQEGRGTSTTGTAKAAKAAAAAAAAAATAAITAARASDAASAKGTRRERDRSAKETQISTEAPSHKVAEKQPGASRGKAARHGIAETATGIAVPTITLLTRAAGAQGASSKGQGKEPSAEKFGASSSGGGGGGRNDARAAQQAGARGAGPETDGGAAGGAQNQEPGKARTGRTAATQQGAARGSGAVAQEQAPLTVRPTTAATPRLLLVKGGEARLTQTAPGSSPAGQLATAAPVATVPAAAKKQAQEPQQSLGQQQQQSQAPRSSSKQPSVAQEHSGAGAAAQSAKPKPPSSGTPVAGERSSGKTTAALSVSGAATGSKSGTAASSAAAPTTSAGSTPAPADGSSPDDGLAATASAAAAAALSAATTGPSGKKVRPGFQMYVPGSLRGRAPGSAAAAGGSSTNG